MAKPDRLFPIEIFGVQDNHALRKMWLKNRPQDLIWYHLDASILNPSTIEFHVFGMKDMCYGGKGDHIDDFVFDVNKKDLKFIIDQRLETIAHGMQREARAARELAAETKERKEIYESLTFPDYQNG